MKRIIKLTISSFYFVWMKIQHFIKRMLKIDVQPICVALYYHSIFEKEKLSFEKQMNLISQKCEVIPSDYSDKLDSNKLYSIITFDDGFENLIYNAVPILKKHNFPFTIFFISGYFGKKPEWEFDGYHPDQNERIMTIEQMNNLPPKLITIGSHTVSHNKLTSCIEEDLVYELEESKKQLENLSKQKVETIAFPNGEYNNFIIQKSLAAGYKRVFTIEPKLALKTKDEKVTGRISVNGNDWYPEFWLKIHGAYSWLNTFSFLIKRN